MLNIKGHKKFIRSQRQKKIGKWLFSYLTEILTPRQLAAR